MSDRESRRGRAALDAFQSIAEEEFESIPRELRDLAVNVAIEVREEPGVEAEDVDHPGELFGLYTGPTRAEMLSADAHGSLPARIFLYRRTIGAAGSPSAVRREVRLTLRHELAHHFGFDDAELERIWPEGA
jgi:predicted Zn-dependent protease with MMP-like domain